MGARGRKDVMNQKLIEMQTQMADLIIKMTQEAVREEVGTCELEHEMVNQYGECVSRDKAAQILGVTPKTISEMQRDGRLGAGVSVRLIARYMNDGKPSAKKIKHIDKYQRRASSC